MIGPLPKHGPVNGWPGWLRSWLAALSVALVGVTILHGSASAQSDDEEAPDSSIAPVSYWQQKFDAAEERTHEENLPLSESGNSWDYYDLAYGIDAYTAMFEATGDTRYADRALEYVNNMVSDARESSSLPDSQYQDEFLGWASERSDTRGEEVPLFESYNWRYVTRLLRVMKQNPATFENPEYRSQYDELLAFSERNIFDKWFERGAEENIFRNRTHMASHWAYIALNLSILTEDENRRARYRAVFDAINRGLPNYDSSLREQLAVAENGGSYVWSSVWDKGKPQDVAHGNNMISYIVEARDLGQEWTAEDIALFIGTLNQMIWVDGEEQAKYVDGSGEGTGWFSDGFVKLGRYDPALQQRLQTHRVQGAQFYAAMAVNALRLTQGPQITGTAPIVGG